MRFHVKRASILLFLAWVSTPSGCFASLWFDGAGQYVTFGTATNLDCATFTIETWFNWTGAGTPANTGNGGILAIPLISKLSPEQDGDSRDGNYYLGIKMPEAVLGADMEEGAAGAKPGLNHPVSGVTSISPNSWHHAAASYDGTNWLLFLDGNFQASLTVGQPPRADSIQHAALGSSLNSTGAPIGYFAGRLDETRIWNHARTPAQIASNRFAQIRSAPGLVGRWGLDEGSGQVAHNSAGRGGDGSLVKGPAWNRELRAAADAVTPFPLSVVDPERTAALRLTEASNVPPVVRYESSVADQVEKNFRASFLISREKFLAALETVAPHRPTNWLAAAEAKFQHLVATFQSTNKGFPLDTNIARLWVEGHFGSKIQTEWATKLRETMNHYISSDQFLTVAGAGFQSVRIFSPGPDKAAPGPEAIQGQSLACPLTNFWPLSRARSDLWQRFTTAEAPITIYVAGFLKENCQFEPELTRSTRLRHTEAVLVTDHYRPGQLIARQGQILDARTKAALEELKIQVAAAEAKQQAAAQQANAETALRELRERATLSEFKSQHFGRENRWLFGALLVVAVTSSIAVWQLARSRRPQVLLPVPFRRAGGAVPEGEPFDPSPAGEWKERALRAEEHAARAAVAMRAELRPHFLQWLKEKLVRGLLADRSRLMSTQEQAEQDLTELEARLAKLHAPMEQRLQLYQQRIAELESELAAKGQESRDLIRAKIQLTRRRLEAEQEKKAQAG